MRYWRRYCGCLCTVVTIQVRNEPMRSYYKAIVGCNKETDWGDDKKSYHNYGSIFLRIEQEFTKVKEKDLTNEEIRAIMLLKFQGKI